jgi:hypothetical protein
VLLHRGPANSTGRGLDGELRVTPQTGMSGRVSARGSTFLSSSFFPSIAHGYVNPTRAIRCRPTLARA